MALLHWVDRRLVVGRGPGSVCRGDGWPPELWDRFASRLDELPEGSIAEKLRAYGASPLDDEVPIVSAWRRDVEGGPPAGGSFPERPLIGWLPLAAELEMPSGPSACLLSWSPSGRRPGSLGEALREGAPDRGPIDPLGQARYYLECTLARLHGVEFGAFDAMEDPEFERSPAARRLAPALGRAEGARLADPAYGRLDRRG